MIGIVVAQGCAEDEPAPSTEPTAGSSGSSGRGGSSTGDAGQANGGAANARGGTPPSVGGSAGTAGSGGDYGDGGVNAGAGTAGLPGYGGEAAVNPFPCNDPEPAVGGYETCNPDGTAEQLYYRRPSKGVCPSSVPREGSFGAGGLGGASADDCHTDADCTGVNEFCTPHEWCAVFGTTGNSCKYGCTSDEDCTGYASPHICVCGELLEPAAPMGLCVSASCKTDSDCAPGFFCTLGHNDFERPYVGCQKPEDECAGQWCNYANRLVCSASESRTCEPLGSCGGP